MLGEYDRRAGAPYLHACSVPPPHSKSRYSSLLVEIETCCCIVLSCRIVEGKVNCTAVLYRLGKNTMGWHRKSVPCLELRDF
jgi:hypothetical protein